MNRLSYDPYMIGIERTDLTRDITMRGYIWIESDAGKIAL